MLFDDIRFNNDLYDLSNSFMLGNSFKNEYKGYKNYKPSKIIVNNDKDSIMLKIYELDFILNDLSLYLDLHPDDEELYKKFKEYNKSFKDYINIFESRYGPLELSNTDFKEYMWSKSNFPFGGCNV
ncbi:MAG: spore coat protein CotJB [Candidatus Coprovivens sp.]